MPRPHLVDFDRRSSMQPSGTTATAHTKSATALAKNKNDQTNLDADKSFTICSLQPHSTTLPPESTAAKTKNRLGTRQPVENKGQSSQPEPISRLAKPSGSLPKPLSKPCRTRNHVHVRISTSPHPTQHLVDILSKTLHTVPLPLYFYLKRS